MQVAVPLVNAIRSKAAFEQICFVVDDLDEALPFFTRRFGAGPWFELGPPNVRIALGYAGDVMFEIAAPHPGSQSVFSDWADKRGHGVHHFGYLTTDFDGVMSEIDGDGLDKLFTSKTRLGARVVMVDEGDPLGALVEYIELLPSNRDFYAFMKTQASHWDRKELKFSGSLPDFSTQLSA